MNVKTTVILFALLVLVGGYLFFTRDKEDGTARKAEEHKLVDVATADTNKLVITPSDGKPIVLEKSGKDWRLTQPVNALADSTEVSSILDSLAALKSTNQVDASGSSAPSTGVDKPQITVELTAAGKTTKIAFGDKLTVGNGVYTKVEGKPEIEVVSADVLDKLDRPASAFRQLKLIETPSNDIKQVTIDRKDGKLALIKTGTDWQVVEPTKMPADAAAVTDLLGAITNLKAGSFVDSATETSGAMARAESPVATVTFSTQPPSTQPTSAPTTGPSTTLAFGAYSSVLKKEVYAKLNDSPFIAKVPVTSLDAFNKKAIELRDKKVLDINPEEVSSFTIATDIPATTQPTSKPAKKGIVTVARRKDGGRSGVPFTSAPATTQDSKPLASTFELPNAKKPSTWTLAADPSVDPDDADITSFLGALHPLKADKYLESNPTTQPTPSYILTIHTQAAGGAAPVDHEIKLQDRGDQQPYIAQANGLTFELSRFTLSRFLESDFKKKPAGANPQQGGPPGGFGGPGGPPGF